MSLPSHATCKEPLPQLAAGGSPPAPGSGGRYASGAPDALPDISEPAHHLEHDAQPPPAARAAPTAASAADSGTDDAAGSKQPPAAAVGPGDVLSSAGHGLTKAAVQATAAVAGTDVSLVHKGCPPPRLLLVAGYAPSITLCSVGWVKEARFCGRRPLQVRASLCFSRLHAVEPCLRLSPANPCPVHD